MITTKKITAQEMIDKGIKKSFYINFSTAATVVVIVIAAGIAVSALAGTSTLVAALFK